MIEAMLALWLTMGLAAGILAAVKGRSFVPWFIYGFLLGAIALIHAVLIRPRIETEHGF